MHARRPARTLLAATLTAGLLLAACGEDDDDTTDAAAGDAAVTTTTEAPAEDQPTVTGVSAGGDDDAAPGTLEVEAVDYAFQGLPESVPAGTKLTFTNSSTAELHELVAMRIPDEEARSLEELGCRVSGVVVWSKFRVGDPAPRPAAKGQRPTPPLATVE